MPARPGQARSRAGLLRSFSCLSCAFLNRYAVFDLVIDRAAHHLEQLINGGIRAVLSAVIDNFLRGRTADMQHLAHLVHRSCIDVDNLSSLSGRGGAAAIRSRHASKIRWW